MINIRTIRKLAENDGLTLKNGKIIRYKTGWQDAIKAIKTYNGNCGVWLENGIYYVDKSHRVNTKKIALEIGKNYAQISVYGWARGNLAYC